MKNLRKNNGLILMISLWILAIISLICISLAHRVIINLKLVKFQRDKVRSLYIAKAAVVKAVGVLEQDSASPSQTDMLGEVWSKGYDSDAGGYIFKDIEVGDGVFTVKYIFDDSQITEPVYFYGLSDEDRKININQAHRDLLVSLFSWIGFSQPEILADNIIYWRGDGPVGFIDSYYESPLIPYPARQAPFKTMEELYLVKGFREEPDLINECERFLTVYTEENLININTAPQEVLKAVFMSLRADEPPNDPNLSDRLTSNIIDFRDGSDNEQATDDDEAIINQEQIKTVLKTGITNPTEIGWIDNQVFPFTVESNLFRIEVLAKLNSGNIQKKANAVIDRSTPPTKIRYWHEE